MLKFNQRGVLALPLLLIAVVGVLLFLFISSNAPLREGLFSRLFPKPQSQAANPWDGVPSLDPDYSQGVETSPAPGGNLIVNFDDLQTGNLSGTYPQNSGISWSNSFIVNSPFQLMNTKSISFSSASTITGTLTLSSPKKLLSVKVYPGGTGTTTMILRCSGNPDKVQSLTKGQLVTVSTDWANPCSSITMSSSLAWEMSFDDFVFEAKLGDLNNDGKVGVIDFSTLLSSWGQTGTNPADLNHDSKVGILDFSILLSNWG